MSKNGKNLILCRKKSLQIDPMDQKKALGTNLLDTNFRRRWFPLNVRKWFEKSLFLKSAFFFQLSRRTRRMRIWFPRLKFLNNWAETICSISDNNGDKNSQKKLSLKTFFWTPTDNAVSKSNLETFLTTNSTPEIFRMMSENDKKLGLSKKLSLRSYFLTLSENGVLTVPAKNCRVAVVL